MKLKRSRLIIALLLVLALVLALPHIGGGADIQYDRYDSSIPAKLDKPGEKLLEKTAKELDKLNPDGEYLTFAFITDLHRGSENVPYAENGVVDDTYSLHLLSRLCENADIDAVFCGGDLVNARPEDSANIRSNQKLIVNDFKKLFPDTSVFSTIGNHDKRYSTANELNGNDYLGELLEPVQCVGNGIETTYIDETNYYVDFIEQKVRIIVINEFDGVTEENAADEVHCTGAWKAGLDIENPGEWYVGVVYHGKDYADIKTALDDYVANGGKGALGSFGGHDHLYSYSCEDGYNDIITACAYATEEQIGTADAYCFSIFVVNPDNGEFWQLKVGREGEVLSFSAK